jgi:hypothetical protein
MDAESNITTNNGRRWGIVYLFHRMAEGTWRFNGTDWYRSQRKLVMTGRKGNWVANLIWSGMLNYDWFMRRQ